MRYYLTSNDDLPEIRGQPKLHKVNAPIRIITCSKKQSQHQYLNMYLNLLNNQGQH